MASSPSARIAKFSATWPSWQTTSPFVRSSQVLQEATSSTCCRLKFRNAGAFISRFSFSAGTIASLSMS